MPTPTSREPGLAVTVLLYALARLGLVAVVAGRAHTAESVRFVL
jgi:hypothetical protein